MSTPAPPNKTDNGCHLLPSQNASLAARWENIPETIILNGVVGLVLMTLFVTMTRIARRRALSDDMIESQNLITFLYGYRDPSLWYVIPRYEFLQPQNKHHNHDMECANVYVPPRLPLANPLEMIASDSPKSPRSSSKLHSPSKPHSPDADSDNSNNSASKSPKSPKQTIKGAKKDKDVEFADSISPKSDASSLDTVVVSKQKGIKQYIQMRSSFIYPSIISAEQLQASYLSKILNKFFSKFTSVTDEDIIYVKGIDAYEYLLFQRHLIFLMLITTILCMGIILPVHWLSNEGQTYTSFQRSTIKNMDERSNLYWAHIICAALIIACTTMIIRSYRNSITTCNEDKLSRRTLLVGNIPPNQRDRVELNKLFDEYFTKSDVEAIQFVYDTSALEIYEMDLSSVMFAKDYCLAYKRKCKRDLMVHPTEVNQRRTCNGNCRLCSFLLVCCCHWPREQSEPGHLYYAKQEELLREKITEACLCLINEPTEYAFVTFKSNRQARKVMKDLADLKQIQLKNDGHKTQETKSRNHYKPLKYIQVTPDDPNDPLSPRNDPHVRSIRQQTPHNDYVSKRSTGRLARGLDTTKGPLGWSIRYAPHPDNVEYRDLLNLATISDFTIGLLHSLMIVIFIFITTPNVIMSIVDRLAVLRPNKARELTGFENLALTYFSIFLQIIATTILPALVTLISRQIPYEDSSSKDHSVMWKVYLFLLLMVIVMPSIGMSSAQALFNADIDPKCLFPTDNGAYYINYVTSSIFISTMLELIKPIDILSYYFVLCTSRSMAEKEGGRRFIEREFSIGMQHTSVLLIFAVVMTYSISCPLITVAGLVFLIVKHVVDHYHLHSTYFTKKVDRNLQDTIVVFVQVGLLFMLFQTTISISINTGASYFSLASHLLFWLTLATYLFNCFFDCTSRTGPETSKAHNKQGKNEFCACFYLPRVIDNLLKLNAIPVKCISRKIQ